MLLRVLLLCFLLLTLYADDRAWYNKVEVKLEAGLFSPTLLGTLSNPSSSVEFKDDFGYRDNKASYFALGLHFDYKYVPNIEINYFSIKEHKEVTFDRNITAVREVYTDDVSTKIDYRMVNVLIHEEFKAKGGRFRIFRRYFYPGDTEFDLGLNLKKIDFLFQIKQTNETTDYRFDKVDALIVLPYLGFKHYYYRFIFFANISALSLNEAQATNYQYGIDFRALGDVYLSVSYLYEDFKATEKQDLIQFKTYGSKFSFKYAF